MFLNNYPSVKTFLSRLRFRLWKIQVCWRGLKVHSDFDIHRTCYANPADIQFVCEDPQSTVVARKYTNRGKIVGGNWDQTNIRFEDTDLYKGFATRFLDGISWQETDLYRRVIGELEAGDVAYGCSSQRDYDLKCRKMDEMFEDIKRHGYRPQKDIAVGEKDLYKGEDEISVCVGRYGDLLFEDGRHRLALAKVLGLERVPIKITMVHKLWHDFRMEVVDYARTHSGKIYQRIWHSIESSIKNVHFMKKLRRAENKHFVIHNCSVFDYQGPMQFNIVLALNIFHHFLKDKGSYQKLIQFLRSLDMDAMFFEPHNLGENTMIDSYLDFSNQGFIDFILENSCLCSGEYIGQAPDGRNLYLLQR